jgi:hypothetical protein
MTSLTLLLEWVTLFNFRQHLLFSFIKEVCQTVIEVNIILWTCTKTEAPLVYWRTRNSSLLLRTSQIWWNDWTIQMSVAATTLNCDTLLYKILNRRLPILCAFKTLQLRWLTNQIQTLQLRWCDQCAIWWLVTTVLEIPARSSFSQGIEVTSPRDENCTSPRRGQFSSRGDVTELPSEKDDRAGISIATQPKISIFVLCTSSL